MDKQLELEFWMPVRGYEGLYDASDWGRVRNARTGMVLKPIPNFGYLRIALYKDGKHKIFRVHRLVWEAFNGPIPEGMQIDHIDGTRDNNYLSNLRVCTSKENHANPITKRKKNESVRKTCGKSVVQIDKETGDVIQRFECARDACRNINGTDYRHISACCRGKLKSHAGYRWCFFMPPALLPYQ